MRVGFIGLGNVGGKLAGSLLRNWLDNPRLLRAFNIGMALLLVASLYPILVDTGMF